MKHQIKYCADGWFSDKSISIFAILVFSVQVIFTEKRYEACYRMQEYTENILL